MSTNDSRPSRYANTNANARLRPGPPSWGADGSRDFNQPGATRVGSSLILSGPKRKNPAGPNSKPNVPRPVSLPSQRKDRVGDGGPLVSKQRNDENSQLDQPSNLSTLSAGTWQSRKEPAAPTPAPYGAAQQRQISTHEFPTLSATVKHPQLKQQRTHKVPGGEDDAYWTDDDRDTGILDQAAAETAKEPVKGSFNFHDTDDRNFGSFRPGGDLRGPAREVFGRPDGRSDGASAFNRPGPRGADSFGIRGGEAFGRRDERGESRAFGARVPSESTYTGRGASGGGPGNGMRAFGGDRGESSAFGRREGGDDRGAFARGGDRGDAGGYAAPRRGGDAPRRYDERPGGGAGDRGGGGIAGGRAFDAYAARPVETHDDYKGASFLVNPVSGMLAGGVTSSLVGAAPAEEEEEVDEERAAFLEDLARIKAEIEEKRVAKEAEDEAAAAAAAVPEVIVEEEKEDGPAQPASWEDVALINSQEAPPGGAGEESEGLQRELTEEEKAAAAAVAAKAGLKPVSIETWKRRQEEAEAEEIERRARAAAKLREIELQMQEREAAAERERAEEEAAAAEAAAERSAAAAAQTAAAAAEDEARRAAADAAAATPATRWTTAPASVKEPAWAQPLFKAPAGAPLGAPAAVAEAPPAATEPAAPVEEVTKSEARGGRGGREATGRGGRGREAPAAHAVAAAAAPVPGRGRGEPAARGGRRGRGATSEREPVRDVRVTDAEDASRTATAGRGAAAPARGGRGGRAAVPATADSRKAHAEAAAAAAAAMASSVPLISQKAEQAAPEAPPAEAALVDAPPLTVVADAKGTASQLYGWGSTMSLNLHGELEQMKMACTSPPPPVDAHSSSLGGRDSFGGHDSQRSPDADFMPPIILPSDLALDDPPPIALSPSSASPHDAPYAAQTPASLTPTPSAPPSITEAFNPQPVFSAPMARPSSGTPQGNGMPADFIPQAFLPQSQSSQQQRNVWAPQHGPPGGSGWNNQPVMSAQQAQQAAQAAAQQQQQQSSASVHYMQPQQQQAHMYGLPPSSQQAAAAAPYNPFAYGGPGIFTPNYAAPAAFPGHLAFTPTSKPPDWSNANASSAGWGTVQPHEMGGQGHGAPHMNGMVSQQQQLGPPPSMHGHGMGGGHHGAPQPPFSQGPMVRTHTNPPSGGGMQQQQSGMQHMNGYALQQQSVPMAIPPHEVAMNLPDNLLAASPPVTSQVGPPPPAAAARGRGRGRMRQPRTAAPHGAAGAFAGAQAGAGSGGPSGEEEGEGSRRGGRGRRGGGRGRNLGTQKAQAAPKGAPAYVAS